MSCSPGMVIPGRMASRKQFDKCADTPRRASSRGGSEVVDPVVLRRAGGPRNGTAGLVVNHIARNQMSGLGVEDVCAWRPRS